MGRWGREIALWFGALVGVLSIVGAIAVIGFGYSLLVFRSGSMEPAISTGALAVARQTDAADLRSGDVVSVTTASGTRVTHRIVDVGLSGRTATLTLKGDANGDADADTYSVTSAPRVVASVPAVGYGVAAVLSPAGMLTAGALGLGLVLLGLRSDQEPRTGGRRKAAPVRSSRSRGRGRVAMAGAVSAAVVVTGTVLTDAAFSDNATATTSAASAPYFTCGAAMSASNPWAWYKADESAPSGMGLQGAADASGNGNGAEYRPSAGLFGSTQYALGQERACQRDSGTAVRFNGSTLNPSYLTTSSNILTAQGSSGARWNTFTVSVWFKSASGSSSGNLIGAGSAKTGASSSHDRHVFLTSAGDVVFGVYPGSVRTIASTGTDYADNTWHLATASLSGAGMKLWVDGQQVASRTDTTTAQQHTSMYWRVGYESVQAWNYATGDAFAGTIDDVGIWTRALSDTEVLNLYRSAMPAS